MKLWTEYEEKLEWNNVEYGERDGLLGGKPQCHKIFISLSLSLSSYVRLFIEIESCFGPEKKRKLSRQL